MKGAAPGNAMERLLCMLDDIPDGQAIEIADPPVVLVRRGDDAWAYRNRCPHFSIPLNYEPDTFWTYDAELVMCAHHSAMFRFEDGVCVDGPCEGARLTSVAIRIDGRRILVGDDARADAQQEAPVFIDRRSNPGDS